MTFGQLLMSNRSQVNIKNKIKLYLYDGIVCDLWCCLKSEPNAQSLILNILDIKFYGWVDIEENKIHEMIFVN